MGHSVTQALLGKPAQPLVDLSEFMGTGIYAIYYSGEHPAYSLLTQAGGARTSQPIYVGKAVATGSRKGLTSGVESKALFQRLNEHKRNIEAAENLNATDFSCRYLVVDRIWIPLGESLLIGRYSPVWNSILDGFGNHDPGAGRRKGARPRWDVLHPGRSWAAHLKPRDETARAIAKDVEEYLRQRLQ